ncbi:Cholesterol 7-alpha-monooxygenase [Tulasnella sp. JGI-2019a]|nr:Cholesterol 7-alpha-monooxygenase [Tulasnella sp. JGI-2019a]
MIRPCRAMQERAKPVYIFRCRATMDWISSSDRLPKSAAEWIVPVATVATLVAGVTVAIKSTAKSDKSPPTVPSWIPWLGNTWQIDADADAFMRLAEKKYPGGIFGVTYAGNKYYFVTSHKLINQVYKQPKTFGFSKVQMAWARSVFSVSEKALFGSMVFPEQLAPQFDKSISPNNMMAILESFDNHLQRIVTEMALPAANESVSLAKFIIQLSYKATTYAMYGPTFDAEGTFEDFNDFDRLVYKVAHGYPPSLLRDFVNGRENFIKAYGKYLDSHHEPSELAGVQERIASDAGFSQRDMGAMTLCALWPIMANVPWGSVWAMIMQLQQPNGVQPLIDELDAAGDRFMNVEICLHGGQYFDYPLTFLQSSPALPLLSSTYSETLRYATDSYSFRGVVAEEGTVLGGYELKHGDTVLCSTRRVHMDEREFENADQWIPERFVANEEGAKGTEGDFKWMPFGGGQSICGGRYLATYHVKIMMMTLLKNFHFEIDHAKSKLPIKLSQANRGFGFRRPEGELFVKIRRISK